MEMLLSNELFAGSLIKCYICTLITKLRFLFICTSCWCFRTATCQREYESRAAVNTVVLHPNQVFFYTFVFLILLCTYSWWMQQKSLFLFWKCNYFFYGTVVNHLYFVVVPETLLDWTVLLINLLYCNLIFVTHNCLHATLFLMLRTGSLLNKIRGLINTLTIFKMKWYEGSWCMTDQGFCSNG